MKLSRPQPQEPAKQAEALVVDQAARGAAHALPEAFKAQAQAPSAAVLGTFMSVGSSPVGLRSYDQPTVDLTQNVTVNQAATPVWAKAYRDTPRDLSFQRWRLSCFLKQEFGPETVISLSRLKDFHEMNLGHDDLGKYVPERLTHRFALHPDAWENSFYNLTLKGVEAVKSFKPVAVEILPGTLVGDMAIANLFYDANGYSDAEKYAEAYKASLKPWPVNLDDYELPELLIPPG